MRFALGCAFNTLDMFVNFPYKKLNLNCEKCGKLIGNRHRNKMLSKIFTYSMIVIVDDIVERNVTFWLPLNGNKKCNMHMKRVTGEAFKKLRQHGKWQDVDFLKSSFAGYEIGLYLLGNRTPRIKTVYVDKKIKEKITKYTNEGKAYGDGKIDTTIHDYLEKIYAKFPKITRSDIKRILTFAWKQVYLLNSYGGDLLVKNNNFWSYFGNLKRKPLQHFEYYKRKLTVKLRIKYKQAGSPWNGYYYFALRERQYQNYLSQIKSRGRKKKYFDFGPIRIYEILDECKLVESDKKYIFRIEFISKLKLKYFIHDYKGQAELIETRKPLKFKDILVSDNEYEFL